MFNFLFKENLDLEEQKVQRDLTSKRACCVAFKQVTQLKQKKYLNKSLF